MRFSPSGLRLFDTCQGAFALRYIHKIQEEDNEFARVGRDVHLLVESKLGGKDMTKFTEHFRAEQETLDIYQNFEKHFLPDINPENKLAQEELVEMQLGEHTLAFKMDYLEEIGGFLTITDWKTTHVLMTVEQMKKDIAVRGYGVGAFRLYPNHSEAVFVIRNLRLRASQYLEYTKQEADFWEESLKALMVLVGSRMKAYESGNKQALPFTPGAGCLNCGYFSSCKAGQEAFRVPKKPSPAAYKAPKNAKGAQTLAERVILLEKHLKEAKKALKMWCEAKGPVSLAGGSFGIFPAEFLAFDPDMVPPAEESKEAMLVREKLVPFLKVDASKTSGFWDDQKLLELLKPMGALKPKTKVEFKFRKDKEEGEEAG